MFELKCCNIIKIHFKRFFLEAFGHICETQSYDRGPALLWVSQFTRSPWEASRCHTRITRLNPRVFGFCCRSEHAVQLCMNVAGRVARARRGSSLTGSTCHGDSTLAHASPVWRAAHKDSSELRMARLLTMRYVRLHHNVKHSFECPVNEL